MKENDKIGYVYLTTNLVNGKQYVGQHLSDGFDKYYKGSGIAITNAINKYGWDNFTCEVICWCSTQTQLNEVEDNYIKLLGTMFPKGYNLKGGGGNGKLCKEARKKMSEAKKKYYESEDGLTTRKKQSEANKGQTPWNKGVKGVAKHTEEARKKMSEAHKGKHHTPESKQKTSQALKGRVSPNKGKKASEETRKKMSEAHKRQEVSEETRKKMSEANKGKHLTKETRKKLSKAQDKYKKKVRQYTLDGEFVKEWQSLHEINRVCGYHIGCITDCCNGRQKTAYKHLWKYAS